MHRMEFKKNDNDDSNICVGDDEDDDDDDDGGKNVFLFLSFFKFHSVHIKLVSPQAAQLEIFFLFTS